MYIQSVTVTPGKGWLIGIIAVDFSVDRLSNLRPEKRYGIRDNGSIACKDAKVRHRMVG